VYQTYNYEALGALSDELLHLIMERMVHYGSFGDFTIDPYQLRNAMRDRVQNLWSFVLSCKRLYEVFCTISKPLRDEMIARATTAIVPRSVFSMTNPFSLQLVREQTSSRQLRFLKNCIFSMATHCASKCCGALRAEINKETKKQITAMAHGTQGLQSFGFKFTAITPIMEKSAVLNAPRTGQCAFVSTRRRVASPTSHEGSPRRRARTEWLVRVEKEQTTTMRLVPKITCNETHAIQLHDVDTHSVPHSMKSNHSGTCVALIRSLFSLDDQLPHGVCQVWSINQPTLVDIHPPTELEISGAVNAQLAWWLDDQLVVLFSSGYVHPMGSLVGSNASGMCCYGIAKYECCNGLFELDEFTGPFSGLAQAASPSHDGTEVIIVKKKKINMMTDITSLALHNVNSEEVVNIDSCTNLNDQTITSIGFSPSADCIVALHTSALETTAEIIVRTTQKSFVSIQRSDLSHWFFTQNDENVKLPYLIEFSPCGRYTTILDQRPTFGVGSPNHAIVVLDLSLGREKRRGVRALPLATVEDATPRSICWTNDGLWVQARHGALLLTAA
jgi:hypothetical protein